MAAKKTRTKKMTSAKKMLMVEKAEAEAAKAQADAGEGAYEDRGD